VGNLDVIRDFSSVIDVVDAYELLLRRAPSGSIFNVSSATATSIAEALSSLCRLLGVEVETETDPERTRSSDIPHLVGDNTRLLELGFRPRRDPFADALLPPDAPAPS
jgi:GDP-4-dehydro-6-deoxy-D-mannose reductase